MRDTRPDLLTHPNIPKPLHGLNPRSIFGDEWWDNVRQKAYAANDYRCWACGIHKSEAAIHHWLEAHEAYDIDYNKGTVTISEIVALCHCCHNFIHSGRLLALWRKQQKTTEEARYILEHGFSVLRAAKLKAFYVAYYAWAEIVLDDPTPLMYAKEKNAIFPPESVSVAWEDWRLNINEKSYSPKLKSFDEWKSYYSNE